MNSLIRNKHLTVQALVCASALGLAGIAHAQYGDNPGGSSSSGSTDSGQSSQKPKSDNPSNSAIIGEDRKKLEERVEREKKADRDHEFDPARHTPRKPGEK